MSIYIHIDLAGILPGKAKMPGYLCQGRIGMLSKNLLIRS
jgi:hypothetical protein